MPVGEPPRAIIISRDGSPQKLTAPKTSIRNATVETLHCNVFAVARSVFRRASTTDELRDCDRRTIDTGNEAKRVRDMRKYPLRARGWLAALKRYSSPRPQRYCAIARPEGARHINFEF